MSGNATAPRDNNRIPTLLGTSSVDGITPVVIWADPTTHRLLTDAASGSGTVTSVAVATANGLAGTVADPTGAAIITLSVTPTGVLYGTGTAIRTALNSDLPVMTATVGGAVPTPPNNTTTFLRGDGTFGTPAGSGGTVTNVSVVSVNGFTGTVLNATTTPAITITTSINSPVLAGNGTALIAATTTGTGSTVVLSASPTITTPTFVSPVLGTPASGVMTNVTGTAAGLTAGTVTTNANLTGPITSTGNATSIAAQTGSGTTFVMQTSPTLITPTIGAALGTSLTLSAPGTSSTDVATLQSTSTFTNKRITKRVLALSANSATPAINTNSYDVVHITAQTAAITSFTSSLTGAPVDGDTLRISVTASPSVAITFGSSFEASTISLSTTAIAQARLDMGFFYNTETNKWRQVAAA